MPLRRTYEVPDCAVAATLGIVGERWTLLIVRELMLGVHRFDDLAADLGIARFDIRAVAEFASREAEPRTIRDDTATMAPAWGTHVRPPIAA